MRLFACLIVLALLATPAAAAKLRTWTSAKGNFEVEAALVDITTGADGDIVLTLLRKKDGKTIQVPLTKLGRADKRYVAKIIASEGKEDAESEKSSSFSPGDGKDRAQEFLTAEDLVEKKGTWSLSAESDATDFFVSADDAYQQFDEAHGQVVKNRRLTPKYNVLEAKLQKQISTLTREVQADRFGNKRSTPGKRALLDDLRRTLAKDVNSFRRKCKADEEKLGPLHDQCRNDLEEAEEEFSRLDQRYKSLAKDQSLLDAAKELRKKLGPSSNFTGQKKKLRKIRAGLRAKEPK